MSEKIKQDAAGQAEILSNGPVEPGRYHVSLDFTDDDNYTIICLECSSHSNWKIVENMTEHDSWHEENPDA